MGFNPRRGRRGASPRRGNAQGGRHNQNYDSNGPGVRIKGTAQQVYDKYCQLARDNLGADDPVLVESYLQHAEHYYRLAFPESRESERSGQDASASDHLSSDRPSAERHSTAPEAEDPEAENMNRAAEEEAPQTTRKSSDRETTKNWRRPRFLEKPSRSDEPPAIYTEGGSTEDDVDDSDADNAQDADAAPLRRTSRRHALGTKTTTRSTRTTGVKRSRAKESLSEKETKQSDSQSSEEGDKSSTANNDDQQEPGQLSLSPPVW